MAHLEDDADEEIEIVDSGHEASTKRTESGVEEFWAVVENGRADETVTVELQLQDETQVLARHERTQDVSAGETARYQFVVEIPPGFDEYNFEIVREDAA